jgi:hypothetical protein
MKNLILGTVVAAMAMQSTACIIDGGSDDDNRIAVVWNYKVNEITRSGCPAGAAGVDLVIKSVNSGITNTFEYPCSEPVLEEYVPDDDYQIWVELVTPAGQLYAKSLSLVDAVYGVDKDITFDIHEDRGFFYVQWGFRGEVSNANLTCSSVAGLDAVSILATPVGTGAMVESDMDCAPGEGVSRALPPSLYTVDLDAINKNSGASFGSAEVLTNQPIDDRNQVTDLNTIIIPIDRM